MIVARAELPIGAWDAFVYNHPSGWFFHTEAWIRYALAYTPDAIDQSSAWLQADDIVAVVPHVAGYGGQPNAEPLTIVGETRESPESWIIRPMRTPMDWKATTAVEPFTTQVLDLSQSEQELWRGLRKSYHSLIHKAEREREIYVVDDQSWNFHAMQYAAEVHREAAGRSTRANLTWEEMSLWIRTGNGVLVRAQNARGRDVGYAYAIRYKNWAYYASGASLERDLSHALIWHTIKTLKADGRTRYFELGWQARESDTDKDRGIAHFKAGFGGEPWQIAIVKTT